MHGDRLHVGIMMSTSPNFSEYPSGQTRDVKTKGDGHGASVDVKVRKPQRRRTSPSTPEGYLQELPALVLLDRLAIPMLAVRLEGVIVYANPALAIMLGHQPDTIALIGQPLSALLDGHSATTPRACVTALRGAGTLVVDWLHAEGFPVRSLISETVFVRAGDQIVLIGATDVTELMWTLHPELH
jgi:PAS domain-containing protein